MRCSPTSRACSWKAALPWKKRWKPLGIGFHRFFHGNAAFQLHALDVGEHLILGLHYGRIPGCRAALGAVGQRGVGRPNTDGFNIARIFSLLCNGLLNFALFDIRFMGAASEETNQGESAEKFKRSLQKYYLQGITLTIPTQSI